MQEVSDSACEKSQLSGPDVEDSHIAEPDIPAPYDGHGFGWTRVNGMLEPLWIEGDLLPPQLVDILQETIDADSEDEESEEELEYSVD